MVFLWRSTVQHTHHGKNLLLYISVFTLLGSTDGSTVSVNLLFTDTVEQSVAWLSIVRQPTIICTEKGHEKEISFYLFTIKNCTVFVFITWLTWSLLFLLVVLVHRVTWRMGRFGSETFKESEQLLGFTVIVHRFDVVCGEMWLVDLVDRHGDVVSVLCLSLENNVYFSKLILTMNIIISITL